DYLDILTLNSCKNIGRSKAENLESFRVQPDPHTVRAGAEDSHLSYTGKTCQRVLKIDNSVVGEKNFFKPFVFGIETHNQQYIRRDFFDSDPLLLRRSWQLS